MKYYSFMVEGRGAFPVDMLRYDRCHPRSSEDAANLLGTDKRIVELIKFVENKDQVPTEGRWNSFGWNVLKKTYFK